MENTIVVAAGASDPHPCNTLLLTQGVQWANTSEIEAKML